MGSECDGKVPYPSERAARQQMRRCQAKRRSGAERLHYYQCAICSNFHLSSSERVELTNEARRAIDGQRDRKRLRR